jgi:hypothetical protein
LLRRILLVPSPYSSPNILARFDFRAIEASRKIVGHKIANISSGCKQRVISDDENLLCKGGSFEPAETHIVAAFESVERNPVNFIVNIEGVH